MLPKTLTYSVVLVCGFLALVLPLASADNKGGDKPALSGTWSKKDGELKIEFADKHVMRIIPHNDREVLTIVCKYTVEKASRVQAEVTGIEGREDAKKQVQQHLPIGFQFSFQWKLNGDAAQLGSVKSGEVERLKSHLEGDFERKK
jgi:hypothetical protein